MCFRRFARSSSTTFVREKWVFFICFIVWINLCKHLCGSEIKHIYYVIDVMTVYLVNNTERQSFIHRNNSMFVRFKLNSMEIILTDAFFCSKLRIFGGRRWVWALTAPRSIVKFSALNLFCLVKTKNTNTILKYKKFTCFI